MFHHVSEDFYARTHVNVMFPVLIIHKFAVLL